MLKKIDPQSGAINFSDSHWIVLHRGKSLQGVASFLQKGKRIQILKFVPDPCDAANALKLLAFIEKEVVDESKYNSAFVFILHTKLPGSIWENSPSWVKKQISLDEVKLVYTSADPDSDPDCNPDHQPNSHANPNHEPESESTGAAKRSKSANKKKFVLDPSAGVHWTTPPMSHDPKVCIAPSSVADNAGNGVFYVGKETLPEQKIALLYCGRLRDPEDKGCDAYCKKTSDGIGGVILDGMRDTAGLSEVVNRVPGKYGHNLCGSFVNHRAFPNNNLESFFISSVEISDQFKRYLNHPLLDEVSGWGTKTGILVFVTIQPVKPREELCIDYGMHSEAFMGKNSYKYTDPTVDDDPFVVDPVLTEDEDPESTDTSESDSESASKSDKRYLQTGNEDGREDRDGAGDASGDAAGDAVGDAADTAE